jgi:hypothetical protein
MRVPRTPRLVPGGGPLNRRGPCLLCREQALNDAAPAPTGAVPPQVKDRSVGPGGRG